MGRKRIYATSAARYHAYRQRKRLATLPIEAASVASPTRKPSRPARLASLLAAVEDLRDEYAEWLESLPDNLTESEMGARLTDTVDRLTRAVDKLADIEPPKGFGRD